MRGLCPTRKSRVVDKPRRICKWDGDNLNEGSVGEWRRPIATSWHEVDGWKRGDRVQCENHALSPNRAEFANEMVTNRVKGMRGDSVGPLQ